MRVSLKNNYSPITALIPYSGKNILPPFIPFRPVWYKASLSLLSVWITDGTNH